ncbi:MAG: serine hydrolase domain-containing protein [Ferruginibacter sp.]
MEAKSYPNKNVEIMSVAFYKICLHCSILLGFVLFYQTSNAQYNFNATTKWLEENTQDMGGRSTLLIFKNDKIVYSNSVNELSKKQKFVGNMIARKKGIDSKELSKDFSPDARIAIASCSKWLSAALVMTFIDDGTLHLKDSVGKFLPILSSNRKGNITIAQCLSHTTGINSGNIKDSRSSFIEAANMGEAVNSIAMLPMDSKPGESFRYSNIGLQIAAAVIEKISGKDFKTLFTERIAAKCSMANTDFGDKSVPLPAGGAFSTPKDYLQFLQMILNDGIYNGKKVLSKESVVEMQKNNTKGTEIMYSPAEAGNWNYGLGEWIIGDAALGVRSDVVTSPGLFGSFPWVDNKNKYCAVLFTYNLQSQGRSERYLSLKRIVDAAVTN